MTIEEKKERYRSRGYTDEEINKELELEIKLGLSTRTSNALRRAGINTIKKLQDFYNNEYGDHSLLSLRNFGKKSVLEVKTKCNDLGIELTNFGNKCLYCGK